MELVEGADLTGPVPIDTAIAYARQIIAALDPRTFQFGLRFDF